MDGWRARALRWNLKHAPDRVRDVFSIADLLHIGGGARLDVQSWGMSAMTTLGCLCTSLSTRGLYTAFAGRPQLGLLALAIPDLNLQVAILLRNLQVPVALARTVLEAALYDLFAKAHPAHIDDWMAVVREVRAMSREQVEDYVAAVTAADGTFTVQHPARRMP